MRLIRVSRTYLSMLTEQLAYGETQFGSRVVDDKRGRISHTIGRVLAHNPRIGLFDQTLDIHYYPVGRTPFVLLYDFDDVELRIHLIIHARADRSRVDLTQVEW
jgi:hypothetical protein